MQSLTISERGEKRLKSGHLWIYSNEVDNDKSPLKSIAPGEQVAVQTRAGRIVGHAMVNPHNLICGKLVAGKKPFDRRQLKLRIAAALGWREQVFAEPYYRLLYAEGDFLPGLIIDRFGDICVVQITSLGLEAFRQDVAEVLQELTGCSGVLFRNHGEGRKLEGFADEEDVIVGEVPDAVELKENGTRFVAPVRAGQKTGWFYDHRSNRSQLAQLAAGKRVLDVFSYIGGWGLQALTHGAESLTAIDSSSLALDCLEENAALNGFADTVTALEGNAFEAMQALLTDGEKFDIVIIDPPAFIKKKKDISRGIKAYQKANELALRLVDKDGLLMSASCSMHLSHERLQDTVQRCARHVDRNLAQVYKGGHAFDHPVHPAIAETEYLKAQLYRRLG